MHPIPLTAIDGTNPIGFLAAVGTLRSCAGQGVDARLSWVDEGRWRPVIHGVPSPEDLVALLDAERIAWSDEPALTYTYPDAKGRPQAEIKPPPAEFRRFLREVLASGRRRSIEQVGAYASDVVVDNNGNTKPTALHFAAGQQRFLDAVTDIHAHAGPDALRAALFGPWTEHPVKSLSWDATVFRDYALRATDPSGEKKGSVPGVEWLAFVGLGLLPVAPVTSPRGPRLVTTGCTGGWKDGQFRWPLWTVPASLDAVRSLLATPLPSEPDSRRRIGIGAVFQSGIERSDQGGYGRFSPSMPA
ncbi:MAG: hypothetical protein D6798_08520 [Deltaproteobacteria bacterium]|nr:MAG: hypothetical protein D6798_08520 [Deltaproteobacteria bacterium]